jgi:hypothetical protein
MLKYPSEICPAAAFLTEATPRERQFGMYEGRRRSDRGQAVELPLSQLHVVAAQRQLPMLLEAVPGRDPSEAIAATQPEMGCWAGMLFGDLTCK